MWYITTFVNLRTPILPPSHPPSSQVRTNAIETKLTLQIHFTEVIQRADLMTYAKHHQHRNFHRLTFPISHANTVALHNSALVGSLPVADICFSQMQ